MKLGLGTVQFGTDYGISNMKGKTGRDEVAAILDFAKSAGIRTIDTAAGYGESEAVLGEALQGGSWFNIVTKTPGFDRGPVSAEDAIEITRKFELSLSKLQKQSIYALLLHHGENLLAEGGKYLMDALISLKEKRLIKKIGVSVYSPLEIESILAKYKIDIVQLPVNVFDQRFLRSGVLKALKQLEVEIHARSAFLQGLLLMDPKTLPEFFNSIVRHLERYHKLAAARNLSIVSASLGFPLGLDEIDVVVCGVNNCHQIEELCASAYAVEPEFYEQFAINDENILNPFRWRF